MSANVLAKLERLSGYQFVGAVRQEFALYREQQDGAGEARLLAKYHARMWDVSPFMKLLKQRFTQWYNGRHKRKGTLWEERFKSVLVEGAGEGLAAMAAYIDLNPVRAGIVKDPKDYRWSGYGEALAGRKRAKLGLQRVVTALRRGKEESFKKSLETYRMYLYDRGTELNEMVREDGRLTRGALKHEEVLEVLKAKGRLPLPSYLRCRVRYFTDGAVLGSREFVDGIFRAASRPGSGLTFGSRSDETAGGNPSMTSQFASLARRMAGSAVVWSWGLNGLRLGSGLLLLPLLLRFLPDKDLGFYYVLLGLLAIVPLADFGLSISVERAVSYAMGGARELKAYGVHAESAGDGQPNSSLLWRLIAAAQVYYGAAAIFTSILLGVAGSLLVSRGAHETSNPSLAWLAWGIALFNAGLEIYASWWACVLRGLNAVLSSTRILFLGYAVKLLLSCVLLLTGAGLVSVFAAGIIASFLIRRLARRACLARLPARTEAPASRAEVLSVLRLLWPNSWRVGLQLLSSYLGASANALICFHMFGLAANAQYGVSMQITGMIQSMAMVWISVKWPLVGQYRARQDDASLRRLLKPRFWLLTLTFSLLALLALAFGPGFLRWIGTTKQLMPHPWFLLLLVHAFFEIYVSAWTFLLATENRVPSLWPMLATNVTTLLLVLLLAQLSSLHLGIFALAPLCTGVLFNYWYWPVAGARNLRTTLFRFMFAR